MFLVPIDVNRRMIRAILLGLAVMFAMSAASAREPKIRKTPLDKEAPFRRILWVTRWDFNNREDIAKICYNAASARFTDILFQVRGEATVFFKSPHEPWAWELSGKGIKNGVGIDPGWDPLAVAIQEGRRRGLRVHAYVNVMPGWAQDVTPRAGSGHVYVDHRSWFMVDSKGRRMKPDGFYACLDPGLPEVRKHLARLIGRMVEDYNVDGVHLDYVRYPHEKGDFSYHPSVVKDFKAKYGKTPKQAPTEWARYRLDQVTKIVVEIREAINRARPGVELSAAVFANRDIALRDCRQDAFDWLKKGYVDAIAPMVYVEEMGKFNQTIQPYIDPAIRSKVWIGIRAFTKNKRMSDEIRSAVQNQFAGVALFSYGTVFPGNKIAARAKEVYVTFMKAKPSRLRAAGAESRTIVQSPVP